MQKIKLLPQQEILKIAAGQVVDRPANVVKELVENSVDAGAKSITVYIENGGKKLIRVLDNGCGMSKKDAKMSFKKHATSKITSLDDLESIQTFGFRGEALASISAVSNVTLATKDEESNNGVKLEFENGAITVEQEVPFSQGTDLQIKNLFYNTPARQKFLKKRETENRHITQLVQSFCLDYLEINFKLFVDGRQTINCIATDCIIKRASQIWGHNFAKNLIKIETKKPDKNSMDSNTKKTPYIYGAITNHQYFRYDRGNIFLFVNNRWVKNHEIQSGLLKGYINVLPPARYPAAFIFVEISPQLIDVNIHPRKEEVKFLHPRIATNILQNAVKKALEEHLSSQIRQPVTFKQESYSQNSYKQSDNTRAFKPFNFDPFLGNKSFAPEPRTTQSFTSDTSQKQLPENPNNNCNSDTPNPLNHLDKQEHDQHNIQRNIAQQDYVIIGQFKKTYILIERPDGLFFVDQHVAHERVLYAIFSKHFENVATIKLLFPQLITLRKEDISLLEPNLDVFKKNGIDIEIFGENQIKVQATPVHLKNVKLEEIVLEVVSWIREFQELDEKEFFKKINDHLHSQMSCKAAIKAGDLLTLEQMQKLLRDLESTESNFACPHGRPTGWMLTTHDIEKKFKRKL
ncbi:DNA mismatch repair endonuclease MutL [Candidatus Dependentiae bacterium]